MVHHDGSDLQQRFDTAIDHLHEVEKSLCSSSDYAELMVPLDTLSLEIADLRAFAEMPTVYSGGVHLGKRSMVYLDSYALAEFAHLNKIDTNNVTHAISVNNVGRVFGFCHRQDCIKDVTPLAALPALNQLVLSNNSIEDLSSLSDLPLLERVVVDHNSMFRNESLVEVKSIKELSVVETNVGNLGWLSFLPHLRSVDLRSNNIADIGAVAANLGLEEILIGRNPITSLEALRHHPNLRVLWIEETLVEDLSPLLDVPNLLALAMDQQMIDRSRESGQRAQLGEKGVSIIHRL